MMDQQLGQRNNADETFELCSVISGSTENSSYDLVSNSFPNMKGTKSHNHNDSSNLSPIIPKQDINAHNLENIWRPNFHRKDEYFQGDIKLYSNSSHVTSHLSKDEAELYFAAQDQTLAKDGKVIHAVHSISSSLKSQEIMETVVESDKLCDKNASIQSYTLLANTDGQDTVFNTYLERRYQENLTYIEDSQADLFESDELSQLQLKNNEELLTQEIQVTCSDEIENMCNSNHNNNEQTPSSLDIPVDVSLTLVCEPVNNNETETFQALNINDAPITSRSISLSTKLDHIQLSKEATFKEMDCNSPPFVPSCASTILKPEVSDGTKNVSATVDDAVSCISASTIPPKITHRDDQLPARSSNADTGNEENFDTISSKMDFSGLISKTRSLSDVDDCGSNMSISIMLPVPVTAHNECSTTKPPTASPIENEYSHTVDVSNSSKTNQDRVLQLPTHSELEENLICQEHNPMIKNYSNRNNASFSSQGTKSSSDLFLSSIAKSSQDFSQTIRNTPLGHAAGKLLEENKEKGRQNESLPSMHKSPHHTGKRQSQENLLGSNYGERNPQPESVPMKIKQDALISQEHEKKLSSLQRFENLCNQIVFRLDDANGSHKDSVDMESYIHRCEYLITKMHTMQKEEKTTLCSALKGVGVSKQKKKMLKKQLEQLKSRHQTLMDIVHKYGEIKNRVIIKGNDAKQKSLTLQDNSISGQNDDVRTSNDKPKLNQQSLISNVGENVGEELTQNPFDCVTPMECVEETQCADNVSQPESDCIVISGSFGEGDYVTATIEEKQTQPTSFDSCIKMQCEPSNDESSKMKTPISTAACNSFGNIRSTISQNDSVLGKTKSVAHKTITFDINKPNVDENTHRKITPFKRKSTSTFEPPMKRKTAVIECDSNIMASNTNSDGAIKYVENLIRSNLNKKIDEFPEGIISNDLLRSTCEEEKSVFVDDVLFTEFQDPSSGVNGITVQNSDNVPTSRSDHSTLNVPEKETVVNLDDDNIVSPKFPYASFGDEALDMLNQSNTCTNRNELKAHILPPSNLNMHMSNTLKSNTSLKESDAGGASQLIPSHTPLHPPLLENLSNNMTSTTDVQLHHTFSQVVEDSVAYKIGSSNENLDKDLGTGEEMQSQTGSKKHLTCEEIKTTTSTPGIDHFTSKGATTLTLSISTLAMPSTQTSQADPRFLHDSVDRVNVPTQFTEQSNSVSLQKPTTGPPSPCSTQGSSLFLVSSREIIRRVQDRQLPSKSASTIVNNGNKIYEARNTSSQYPLSISEAVSNNATNSIQRCQQLKPDVHTHFNLEPSAVSLNAIMTSSLCVPQSQNSSKDIPKPKRARKKKSNMMSHFTQTSPEIPTAYGNKNICRGIHSVKHDGKAVNSFDEEFENGEQFVSSRCGEPMHRDLFLCKSKSVSFRQGIGCQENSRVYSIINGLRKVQLIADQELIPPSKGGIPMEFWDEDFAHITMSKAIWDSVVEW